MNLAHSMANPFALLTAPDAVFAELERSDGLRYLTRRVCKPLDDREAKKVARELTTLAEVTSCAPDSHIRIGG
jgi:hypothetical protein